MSASSAVSTRRRFRIAILIAVATALLSTHLTVSAAARPFPTRLELPNGFQPEGIAIGAGPTAWFGSRVDGDIFGVNLLTGKGKIVSEGPGTASVGLDVDRRGRLFVAGGDAGDGRVVDTRSGQVLKSYQFSSELSFINDVLLTATAAWFTNSAAPELYAVPRSKSGAPGRSAAVRTVQLSGAWEQGEGFGANGLTSTPDRSALLVVHSTRGELHRVSPTTGKTTVVDLGGVSLVNGDGMLLRGRTLYVVQNRLDQIAVIELDRAGRTGKLTDLITSADFDVPTTVASFGPRLYLPNGRFTTDPTADTEYWVSTVRRH